MKKAALCILALLITFSFLAACAADSAADFAPAPPATTAAPGTVLHSPVLGGGDRLAAPPVAMSAPVAAPVNDMAGFAEMEQYDIGHHMAESNVELDPHSVTDAQAASSFAERIIYNASAEIETLDFDTTIDSVHEMLRHHGGFIENSFVSGRNQWERQFGHTRNRTANFTLRVPVERLNTITDGLEGLGNVLSLRNEAINITAQFVDTEARLSALRIQEERLLNMLRLTDNVADMIIIEQSLSEVRVSIESMTATIRNWENQINFSTLTLFIFEVEEFAEFAPGRRTYWQQVGDGFVRTIRNIGWFFTDLFGWFIINLPVLIVLAAVVFVAQLLIRKKLKKERAKRNQPSAGEDNS